MQHKSSTLDCVPPLDTPRPPHPASSFGQCCENTIDPLSPGSQPLDGSASPSRFCPPLIIFCAASAQIMLLRSSLQIKDLTEGIKKTKTLILNKCEVQLLLLLVLLLFRIVPTWGNRSQSAASHTRKPYVLLHYINKSPLWTSSWPPVREIRLQHPPADV